MPAELLSTSHGQTMVLTLSNPEYRNALGPEIYAAGVEALNVAESSAEIRSVVITGAGGMFSAGGNLRRLQANREQPAEVQAQSIEGLHSWIESIRSFPKPVVAAVEGAAAGAGFSLALACSFPAIAEDDISKVNGSIETSAGQRYGDLETVNGAVRVAENVQARDASTVNGSAMNVVRREFHRIKTISIHCHPGTPTHAQTIL